MRNPVSQNPANRAFGGLFGVVSRGHSHSQLEKRPLGASYPDHGCGTPSIWAILLGLLARLGARQDLEDDP